MEAIKLNKNLKFMTHAAAIAALYVLLTWLSNLFGMANGAVQLRLSEALCILPCFTSAAIPGLTIGCMLANLVTGCALWDVVFGSFATFLGAVGTYYICRISKWAASIPPVIANVAIVPIILMKVYGSEQSWPFLALTVGAGELISCCVFGMVLYGVVDKYKNKLF
jgi:uncharacterized membrane protein